METTRSPYIKQIYVCVNQRDSGVCCASSHAAGGGEAIREKLKAFVKANGLKGKVRVSASGCMDLCAKGPNVMVYPDYRWYRGVTLADVDTIIERELAPLVSERANGEPIKAFLFDLGNVLVQFNHQVAAERIASAAGTSAQELYRLFFDSPLVVDHDEGRISTRAFYEELKKQIGLQASFEEFLTAWNSIFAEDSAMMNLAGDLLDRYPCVLISNTNRPHFEYCRKVYPVLNRFSGWVLSYEVGVLKPHPVIYHRALELMRLPASQIFYVDDREDLIAAGANLGFQTHRFTGADLLKKELAAKGIDFNIVRSG